MTIKNRQEKVEIKTIYRDLGNWNYFDRAIDPVYSKPIAVIEMGGDEFVFSHDDLFKILEAYLDVDERSMEMILNRTKNSGMVKNIEMPFIKKIKQWVSDHSNEVTKVEKQSSFY